jgi:hypothetical protein
MSFGEPVWTAGDSSSHHNRPEMAMRPALWLPNSKLRAIEERLDANNGIPQTAEEYIVSVRWVTELMQL